MTEQTKTALDNILDTFSGGDGGFKFIMFNNAIRRFDEEAEVGSESARQLILLVRQFSRLIDSCQSKK